MTIQRVPNVPFAQIANAALRDKRLSFKARGILALVLSNVGEWEATARWLLDQSEQDGATAIQSGLNELTALGYRRVRSEQDSRGYLRSVTEWFHEPVQSPGYPMAGKPDDRETGALIEHYLTEHHLTEQQGDSAAPTSIEVVFQPKSQPKAAKAARKAYSADFEAFWQVYPRKVAKDGAWAKWQVIVRDVDPQIVIAGAARYRDDPNRDDTFTAYPTTWLNQGRWLDEDLPPQRRPDTAGNRRMEGYKNLWEVFADDEGRQIES